MPARRKEYILGTDADELFRLGFQHELWLAHAAAVWDRAGFKLGQHLLDVGCGPGFAAFDLAQRVGKSGAVDGVDQSERFIRHLRQQARARGVRNLTAIVGDVANLDFPADRFDGAFARWVLCFVPEPEAVLAGVARALKRGAAFVIQDYYRYEGITIAPGDPVFPRVFSAVAQSWRQAGGNPDIGCDLPGLMRAAGFELREVNAISRLARPGTPFWQWPDTFFVRYLDKLVDLNLIPKADAARFHARWQERSADPSAFFVSPPMIEIIGVKT